MKKIAILTYPIKHRKTFDLVCLLKANGYEDVKVYGIPFHYTKNKNPLIIHRPEMNYNIPTIKELCLNFQYSYEEGQINDFNIKKDRIVLIGGAGIIPDFFIDEYTVINAHPGYIPNCRGLDALKWAIIEKQPIGVTTHLLGDYIDAGEVIERRKIEVKSMDTFHSLAQRVYENEISMLVEAIELIDSTKTEFILPDRFELHKRMPEELESTLFIKFEEYKNKFLQIKKGK